MKHTHINDTYFETLAECYDQLTKTALDRGYDKPEYGNIESVPYLKSFRKVFDLTKDGKPQKSGLVVIIYRMDSGTYELTHYIN